MPRKSASELRWKNGRLCIGNTPVPHFEQKAGSVTSAASYHEHRDRQLAPKRTNSFPPVNAPGDERFRRTSGFPSTLHGNASQGSAPAEPAAKYDHYRESHSQSTQQQRSATKFGEMGRDYHRKEREAESARKAYSSQRRKRPSRGQSEQAWHEQTSNLARTAIRKYNEVVEARSDMAENFIGYDSQQGARGHRMQVENKIRARRNIEGDEEKREAKRASYLAYLDNKKVSSDIPWCVNRY
ncbi:uncharacterized protein N7459_007149 [Penicillium hispanicum]|uniref:uncharacterized protein n=1 Tax=Penicillium hispanicum TaxID=1080232 RepID=UPI0025403808|nr:uncharacterized protein N7459_007149 [Penicillium hispanicum]KAJ5578185.1 hypothetical protein N7459_007149 [Penicillium hispanicum]